MEYVGYDLGGSSAGPAAETGETGETEGGWRAVMGWLGDRFEDEQQIRREAQEQEAELREQQWEVAGSIGTAGFESVTAQVTERQETIRHGITEAGEASDEAARQARLAIEAAAKEAADAAEGAAWKLGLTIPIGLALATVVLGATAAVVVGGVVLYTNPQILAGAALAKASK